MTAETLAADLAERFHLSKRARSWGGECPCCSYFGSFSIKVSRKFDRPLLYCSNGCSREQLDAAVTDVLGSSWKPTPPPPEKDVEKARTAKRAVAERLWRGSEPCAGTPAAHYLAGRGLAVLTASSALRFRSDCWHPERSRLPALIACVVNADGLQTAVHRTFLTREGAKAAVDPVKCSLGPIWGAAIRINPVAAELVIAEGLETAASAGILLGLPAWAAISAGNLAAGLILPTGVRSVVIAGDNDGPGRRAAHDAAARWRAEGRTVRIAMPDVPGQDFNDVLQSRPSA